MKTMRFLDMVKMSWDDMLTSIKQLMMTIVLMVVGIILVGASIYLYNKGEFNKKICEDIITKDLDKVCYIDFLDVNKDIVQDLYDEVNSIEEIEHIGNFSINTDFDNSLKGVALQQRININESSILDNIKYGADIATVYINYDLVGAFDIKLMDDKLIEKPHDEKNIYVYLGAQLMDIPVGTVYEKKLAYYDENEQRIEYTLKYEVRGYMNKGTKIWADYLYNTEISSMGYYNMDNGMLMIEHDVEPKGVSNIQFTLKDDVDFKQVFKKVTEVASKYEADVYCGEYESVFEQIEYNNRKLNEYFSQLAVVIMFSVIMIQLCVQSSNIVNSSKRYGIYFANGLSKRDVYIILIVENIIKMIVSIIISIMIVIKALNNFYEKVPDSLARVLFEIKTFVVADTLAISVLVVAAGTLLPMGIIAKMKPAMLIKELGD